MQAGFVGLKEVERGDGIRVLNEYPGRYLVCISILALVYPGSSLT